MILENEKKRCCLITPQDPLMIKFYVNTTFAMSPNPPQVSGRSHTLSSKATDTSKRCIVSKRFIFQNSDFFYLKAYLLRFFSSKISALFGQRSRRGRWPMLSHWVKFLLLLQRTPLPPAWNLVSRLKFQSWGSNLSLKATIPVLRLKSQSRGLNPSLKA